MRWPRALWSPACLTIRGYRIRRSSHEASTNRSATIFTNGSDKRKTARHLRKIGKDADITWCARLSVFDLVCQLKGEKIISFDGRDRDGRTAQPNP